jgi:carbamate kinase
MRLVVALGGNAISRRGEALTVVNQRRAIREACTVLAACARGNELVITHGNGPQVGDLAVRDAASLSLAAPPSSVPSSPDPRPAPYPLDVLGAET